MIAVLALLLAVPAFVQSRAKDCGGAASPCSVSITTTGGNANLVAVSYDGTGAAVTLSDSASNGYTKVATTSIPGDQAIDYYAKIGATAVTSVSATWTGTNCCVAVQTSEYSGALATGNANTFLATVATHTFTMAATLQQANNFVAGTFQIDNGSRAFTTGTGTERCQLLAGGVACVAPGTGINLVAIDNTAASTTSVTLAGTITSGITTATGMGVMVELCQSNPCVAAGGATATPGRRSTRGAGQ